MKLVKTNQNTNVKLVTVALLISTVLSAMEGSIVSTAMPTIVAYFHDFYGMNWIFSIYLLASSVMTPVYGKLSDQFGRKPIFITGLIIFIISSMLAGFANNMTMLIVIRLFQGIGAGVILPISNTIIADIYSFQNRAKVMGINNSIWGISFVLAPIIGGFIVDNLGWQWIFWINVPLGLFITLLILRCLYETKTTTEHQFDYLGIIYFTIMISSIMAIIATLGKRKINLSIIAFAIILIVIAAVFFARRENSFADPLIPMKLFHSTTFVVQNLIIFLISGYLIALNVYLPDWIQGILRYRASFVGLAMVPTSLAWIVGSFVSGWLITKLFPKQITNIGLIFILIGSVSMIMISKTIPLLGLSLISAVSGLGLGIVITNTTVAVQNEVGSQNIGVATSFNTLCRNIGQILFITILGIVMNTSLRIGSLQTDRPQHTLKLMSNLIAPKTAQTLSAKTVSQLTNILFSGLHNVFVIGVGLVIIVYIVNMIDRKSTH